MIQIPSIQIQIIPEDSTNLTITRILDYNQVDSIDNMTNTCRFSVPLLTGSVEFADQRNIILSKTVFLNIEKFYKVKVLLGYNNKLDVVFLGYITNWYLVNSDVIEFECEDEMFMFKKSTTLKKSFPSPIRKDIFKDDTTPTIVQNKYNDTWNTFVTGIADSDTLKFHHILHYFFSNIQVNGKKYVLDYPAFVSNVSIHKTRMNDYWHLSDILDQFCEKYQLYCYFKLYDQDGARVPKLVIGNRYQDQSESIDLTQYVNKNTLRETHPQKDASGVGYYFSFDFAFPRKQGKNIIIEHDLKYVTTKRNEYFVLYSSTDSKTGKVIYSSYPTDKEELQRQNDRETLTKLENERYELEKNVKEAQKASEKIKKVDGKNKIVKITKRSKKSDEIIKGYTSAKEALDAFNIKYDIFIDKDFDVLNKQAQSRETKKFIDLSQKDLDEMAKRSYEDYRPSGLTGTFTTFAYPYIQIGDLVTIQLHNSSSTYHVDKVERNYSSQDGITQRITLGNAYLLPL